MVGVLQPFGGWPGHLRLAPTLLVINCFAYLAHSMTDFLLPQYEAMVWAIVFPATLGELAIMLWLLIRGAKERQPLPAAAT